MKNVSVAARLADKYHFLEGVGDLVLRRIKNIYATLLFLLPLFMS